MAFKPMKYKVLTPEITALFDAVEELLDKKIARAEKKKETPPTELKITVAECAELEILAKAAGAKMDKEYENYHISNKYCVLAIRTLGRGIGCTPGQRGAIVSGGRTYAQNFWVNPIGRREMTLKEALGYLRDETSFDLGAALMDRLVEAQETRHQATERVRSWATMLLPIGARVEAMIGPHLRVGTVSKYPEGSRDPAIELVLEPTGTIAIIELSTVLKIVSLPEGWELTDKYFGCGKY